MEQRRLYAQPSRTRLEIEQELTAMLRAAVLLCGELLVTDAMLLDGEFFLSLGPEQVAARLGLVGQPLPMVVLVDGASLEDALQRKRERESFVWQTREVAAGLGIGTEEWARSMEPRWQEWIAAARAGVVSCQSRRAAGGGTEHGLAVCLDSPPPVTTEPARRLLALVEEHRWSGRSDVVAAYERLRGAGDLPDDELTRVLSWWNDAYRDAVAGQQGAAWIRFTPSPAEGLIDASAGPRGRRRIGLSGDLVDSLVTVPSGVFGALRHALRDERDAFARKPTTGNLDAIAYGAQAGLEVAASRRAVLTGAVVRLLFAVLALVAGSSLVPELLEGVDAGLLGLALLAVVTVPWSELATIRRAGRRRLRGVISVTVEHGGRP